MLTIPINYTQLGGTYEVITGVQAGQQVLGQDPLWLAWASDLMNLRAAGDTDQVNYLLEHFVPARFKVGQMIGSMGILMGVSYAMYRNVDRDKLKQYKSMFSSAALAVFLTGVTEPLEFMFMFAALPLYLVYAVIQGLAFAMADIIHLRVHSFGVIELLTRTPLIVKAGLRADLLNFILACLVFAVLSYFVANFMIQRFKYATPGRLGNYENEGDAEEIASASVEVSASFDSSGNVLVDRIIALLGGSANIENVDACMTHLRVTVKDPELVGDEKQWKDAGGMGLIVREQGIQAVYGPKADGLKNDIQDALDQGVVINAEKLSE